VFGKPEREDCNLVRKVIYLDAVEVLQLDAGQTEQSFRVRIKVTKALENSVFELA
jgi:hypothetical protein